VAFIRHETRNGKKVFCVVEAQRVPAKEHPRLVTLAYLGPEPHLQKHLAAADVKCRALAERRGILRAFLRPKPRVTWQALEELEPDLVAFALRGCGRGASHCARSRASRAPSRMRRLAATGCAWRSGS
jgi:hypothetical protein